VLKHENGQRLRFGAYVEPGADMGPDLDDETWMTNLEDRIFKPSGVA